MAETKQQEIERWLAAYNEAWQFYDSAYQRGDKRVQMDASAAFNQAVEQLAELGIHEDMLVRDPRDSLTWMLPDARLEGASE